MIREKLGDPDSAGWACVRAAWVCDDAKNDRAASQCRLKAVKQLLASYSETPEQDGFENVVLVALLLRAGAFEQARAQCEEGLRKETEKAIRKCLVFEKELIEWGDAGCYTLDYIDDPGPEPVLRPGSLLSRIELGRRWRKQSCGEELQEKRKAWKTKAFQPVRSVEGRAIEQEEDGLKGNPFE